MGISLKGFGKSSASGSGASISGLSALPPAAADVRISEPVAGNPHRYWRINATANGASAAYPYAFLIVGLEFYESTNGSGTDVSNQISSAITSSTDPSYPTSNVFDANSSTYWQNILTDLSFHWFGVDFGAGNEKDINSINYYKYNGGSGNTEQYTPATMDIQYSDDGIVWTTKWSVTSVSGTPQLHANI